MLCRIQHGLPYRAAQDLHISLQVMIDTSGWALIYPLLRLSGVRVACYTHYPTISTDMLQRVRSRQAAFNNSSSITSSTLKSAAKLLYYYQFAAVYGAAGGCANVCSMPCCASAASVSLAEHIAHLPACPVSWQQPEHDTACLQVVMVNSSWTLAHISSLWWRLRPPRLVYPPCNVSSLAALPLDRKLKSLYLVSLAQFRPEKNHAKQLRAFALACQRAMKSWTPASEPILAARLKLIGSCRGQDDTDRVAQLVICRTDLTFP
jgi:alpha-1,2-mannosyltransferase